MPKMSSAGAAIYAAQDLAKALQNPALVAPFATLGTQLSDIFSKALPVSI
jgi:hypothetical protein